MGSLLTVAYRLNLEFMIKNYQDACITKVENTVSYDNVKKIQNSLSSLSRYRPSILL
jgi:hypothetical protein